MNGLSLSSFLFFRPAKPPIIIAAGFKQISKCFYALVLGFFTLDEVFQMRNFITLCPQETPKVLIQISHKALKCKSTNKV